MSEDLRTYFSLKHVGLNKEDRRRILLSNQSNYTLDGVSQALRVSFYDVLEREKSQREWNPHGSKGQYYNKKKHYAHLVADEPEDYADANYQESEPEEDFDEAFAIEDAEGEPDDQPEQSDMGASGDEEVFEAYAGMDRQRKSYHESRTHLRNLQKSRGLFHGDVKGEIGIEDRRAAVQKEKQRSRCAACGKIGHWAGDAICAKSSKSGPKKVDSKKKGSGKREEQGQGIFGR